LRFPPKFRLSLRYIDKSTGLEVTAAPAVAYPSEVSTLGACFLLFVVVVTREIKAMITDDERTALQTIIQHFEAHYKNGPEMFASRSNFNAFINTEVQFHAKLLKVDLQEAKVALIAWIEQNHTMDYILLAQDLCKKN
jgi:heme oxygenase